jgi:hypothetical protein
MFDVLRVTVQSRELKIQYETKLQKKIIGIP